VARRVKSRRRHGVNGFFMSGGEDGNVGGNSPADTTPEVEMVLHYLALARKIVAILDLIIKALVIILRR
jgi:hypothetical protein